MKANWFACGVLLASVAGSGTGCGNSSSKGDTGRPDASASSDAGRDGGSADASIDAGSDASTPERPKGPPPEVTANAKQWPVVNHDLSGSRATTDSKIDSSNVTKLKQVWTFELPSGGLFGAATAEPLVLGDTVYYIDMQSNVFALELATGKKRWSKEYDRPTSGPNGLAVGWGKVFVPAGDHAFTALDAKTGKELWVAPIKVPKNGGIDITPLAYDGLVYLSTVPVNANADYVGGVTGTLYALDEATGAVVWSFETIDTKDRWGNPDLNSGGGAWYAPTLDAKRGVMYWGIGNPGPYPGTEAFPNGSSRPGDNLYTSSVVALDHAAGKLQWYHQERKHDLFDLDFQNPPIIAHAKVAGKAQDIVIGSGKTGTVTALDADHGKLLWRASVGKHQNDDVTEIPDAGIEVLPGDLGGVETPPAYADGVVYVPVVNWSRTYFPTHSGDQGTDSSGELVALKVEDGSVLWKQDLATGPSFGAATVVNDIVLTSTVDGTVYAFRCSDGKQLWTYTAPLGVNAPLVVVDDKLFIPAGSGLGAPALIVLGLK